MMRAASVSTYANAHAHVHAHELIRVQQLVTPPLPAHPTLSAIHVYLT